MKRFLIVGCVALMAATGCAQNKYRRSSPETYYENGQKALKDGKCYPAELLFRNMLMDFPGSHLTDDAQFGLGQAAQCRGEYLTSIFEYERLLNEYPVSPHAPAARFQIGESYYQQARDIHHDQDETNKAIQEFTRFIEDYPTGDLVDDAEARILDLRNRLALRDVEIAHNYLHWGYVTSAKLYAEDIIENFQGTEAALEAKLVVARVKIKTRDLQGAMNDLTLLAGQDLVPKLKKTVIELTVKIQKELQKK
jgi:outer membrane protein assembly factor BamD